MSRGATSPSASLDQIGLEAASTETSCRSSLAFLSLPLSISFILLSSRLFSLHFPLIFLRFLRLSMNSLTFTDSVKSDKPSFFKKLLNKSKHDNSTNPKLKPPVLHQAVADWDATAATKRSSLQPLLLPAQVAKRASMEAAKKPNAWGRVKQVYCQNLLDLTCGLHKPV